MNDDKLVSKQHQVSPNVGFFKCLPRDNGPAADRNTIKSITRKRVSICLSTGFGRTGQSEQDSNLEIDGQINGEMILQNEALPFRFIWSTQHESVCDK